MEKVRYGIIGLGAMGSGHANYLSKGEDPNAVLAAVCDSDPAALEKATKNYSVPGFSDYKEMYASGLIDVVLVATPHYDHPQMSIDAFEAGIHVLCEKPAGVYTNQVREMNEAHAMHPDVKFTCMFLMRKYPAFAKIKDLIDSGELGNLKRASWTNTTWYRPQAYHDSSEWRGTWDGEGGGVLIIQCPHNIDLWQWFFGVPDRIQAHMSFGKYYDIDVEDDVTAYLEYDNGFTGTFIVSTGEAPGTNRLEIVGDMGKLVLTDNEHLEFHRNRISEREHNRINKERMAMPECWKFDVPVTGANLGHKAITRNLSEAILFDKPLFVQGEEGMNSLQISNAMHLSAWTNQMVSLPVDEDKFYELLQEHVKKASRKTFRK